MLVPTILTADPRRLKEDLDFLKGKVERVQIDIVDGKFAPNKTIAVNQLVGLVDMVDDNLRFDFHLMVDDPAAYLEKGYWPGATDFIIAQIEKMASQTEFCRQAKEQGFKVGLAVDLETPLENLEEMALDFCDQVLILGVKAGFSGQKFSPQAVKKITNLRRWRERERWQFLIGVDGGLNKKTIPFCRQAGAEIFYVGGAIWKAKNPGEEIERLKELT